MTNQNNAAQPPLTGDEIRAAVRQARSMTAPSDTTEPGDYVMAGAQTMLSKLRAPVGDERHAVDPCGYVAVKGSAVDWLKDKFPALTIKAGLCERIGGRLYTITRLMRDHDAALASAPVAGKTRAAVDYVRGGALNFDAHPDGAPVAGEAQRRGKFLPEHVTQQMIWNVQAVIEAECNGLALDTRQARNVMSFLMNEHGPDAAPQASAEAFAKLQSAYIGACDQIERLLAEKQASAENAPVTGEAFMYGIMGPDGKAHFEEFCVSGDRTELQTEVVDHLNRDNPEDGAYSVVALFRDAAPQASAEARWIGIDLGENAIADVRNAALEQAYEAVACLFAAHYLHGNLSALAALKEAGDDIRALKHPQAPQDVRPCSCPSGDGSLRHPCAAHPAKASGNGGEQWSDS
ncbi:hypothetical protein ACOTF3_04240 [Achromobacter xylosoxidans]